MYQTYRVVDLAPQRSDIKRKAQAQVSLSSDKTLFDPKIYISFE